jgi:hypothetical protein
MRHAGGAQAVADLGRLVDSKLSNTRSGLVARFWRVSSSSRSAFASIHATSRAT